jgi:Family of unknown function (DUF6194)
MNESEITQYIANTFAGVDVVVASKESGAPEIAWGDTFFSYDPNRNLPPQRRFPFATIVTKDYGEFDNASNLNRPGVFRLNIGVSKETYQRLFGSPPSDDDAAATYDFTALDRLMPHPIYGPQSWICVLNPSATTFEAVKPLLAEAYERSVRKISKSVHEE